FGLRRPFSAGSCASTHQWRAPRGRPGARRIRPGQRPSGRAKGGRTPSSTATPEKGLRPVFDAQQYSSGPQRYIREEGTVSSTELKSASTRRVPPSSPRRDDRRSPSSSGYG